MSRLRDVVDAQRDVVQPRPALLDVFRDGGIRRRPFEQLQLRAADRDEVGAHALRRDLLGRLDLQPERVAIEGERGGQVFHGNADVIENGFHIPVAVQEFLRGFRVLVCVVATHRVALRNKSVAAEYGSSSRAAIRSTIDASSPGASMSRSR